MKIDEVFSTEYEFTLENIAYTRQEAAKPGSNIRLTISDTVNTELDGKSHLRLSVTRSLQFSPQSLFSLSVTFGLVLSFIDSKNYKPPQNDWSEYFAHNPSPYFENVMPRISALIAQITASYGQQPLITPPSFIQEAE